MSSETSGTLQTTYEQHVQIIANNIRLLADSNAVIELRAPKCKGARGLGPHVRAGFFDHDHVEQLAIAAIDLNTNWNSSVYITFNPVDPDLLARCWNRVDISGRGSLASDTNILGRRWLLVDIDPDRPEGISSTDHEKECAWETTQLVMSFLRGLSWPDPILADSGNGFHLLYFVSLPADDGGLVAGCLAALARQFDTPAARVDQKVSNASRITKLYGTLSIKGDSTPERPYRWSGLLQVPNYWTPVPRELLEALAATAAAPARAVWQREVTNQGHLSGVLDRAASYIATLPRAVSGRGGHNATFHAACALVLGFDLSADQAYPLLVAWNETHCEPTWSERDLRHKLEGADKRPGERGYLLNRGDRLRRDSRTGTAEFDIGDMMTIDVENKNLAEVTSQAWAAVENANQPPSFFRFGGLPVRIELDDHDEPLVRELDVDRMRHHLARVVRWVKTVGGGDRVRQFAASPPLDVVKDVLAMPDMPLPVLTRIVEAPVFASDGTLQTDPGYHAASRTLYVPRSGFQVPTVSEQPLAEEVSQARSLFCDDLLVDFPFVDKAERAHALALLLLPFARDLIAGATPLHLFEKPSPGTGATLLVEMLSYPATGLPIPTMAEARDEEEWRKRLTAKLRNSPQFLLIDNVRHKLDSGALAAAITSPKWEDRLLGQSVTLRMHVRCAWLATGNNPVVSSEMARRIIRIRLDAKMDRPWLREEFKHDLPDWSRRNRDRLVWAALTLIRAWIAAGRPLGSVKLGMFENWSQVMGGILQVAGIPGFLSNLDDFYDESDAEGSQWRVFATAWWSLYQNRPAKAADLFRLLGDDISLPLGEGTDHSRKVRLGQLLSQARHRIFELEIPEGESQRTILVRLQRGEMKGRSYRWNLERMGSPENGCPVSLLTDSHHTHLHTHADVNPCEIIT
jgi:hypothetical protein